MTESGSAGNRASGSHRVAWVLALLMFYGVLTIWVRLRWAVSLLQTGLFLTAAIWMVQWARGRTQLRWNRLLWTLVAAPLWGLVQLAAGTTVYRFETWEATVFWFSALTACFLAFQTLGEKAIRQWFLRALLVFGIALGILGTTQYFTSGGKVFWLFDSGYPDAFGPFVYRNNYAAFAELLLPLAVVQALRDRRHGTTYAILAGVLYASVIASASRAGSVLATAELLAVPLVAAARKLCGPRRLWISAGLLLSSAAVFATVVGWSTVIERLRRPDPFVHRREMLLSSLEMARDRPWMGFGLGTYQETYPAYALFDLGLIVNHAHNDWAEWLAEGGVPFLLIVASFAAFSAGPAARSVWGLGLISVYLHALVDYPMQRLGLAVWVFVLGAAVALEDQDRRHASSL